jgi:RimJ/RimL family protein N-acetyltransferase
LQLHLENHVTEYEVVLETERLKLEPLHTSHAPEMFAFLSDPRLYEFIPRDPPATLASLLERFQRLETRRFPKGDEIWLNWVVRSKLDNQCLGRVEVTIRQDTSAYLAYEIEVASWGNGFATEACRRVIEALFGEFGVTLIVAEVDTRNSASIRVLERLGFQRGGLRKNADFFKGSASDEFTYTLTRQGNGRGQES